jgi:hypothetical protein
MRMKAMTWNIIKGLDNLDMVVVLRRGKVCSWKLQGAVC